MNIQTKEAVRTFSEFVNHAHSILQLPHYQIKKLFPNTTICFSDYEDHNGKSKVLEIRFADKKITLSCLINKAGLCHFSFLFFDSLENFDEFVNYLSENHDYDFERRSWILTKGYIRIRGSKDDIAFMCYS